MNESQFQQGGRREGGRGGFNGPKGMTVAQAKATCAQVHNWALLATSMDDDPRRVPVVPDIPLKRLCYAMDTLTKANLKPGISESTIAALVCARALRPGVAIRSRRTDGSVVTLTLTTGARA